MRRGQTRTMAATAALAAGAVAAFALRPASHATAVNLAARNPAVEVRTQTIERTIHIIRHEPGARLPASSRVVRGIGHGARARTGASGAHR